VQGAVVTGTLIPSTHHVVRQ